MLLGTFEQQDKSQFYVKFRCSEKATKIVYLVASNCQWKMEQFFLVFSEYLNITKEIRKNKGCIIESTFEIDIT